MEWPSVCQTEPMSQKILNREAAQKARDRKKDLMESMEESLAQLRWENEYLRSSNRMLRLKFIEQEEKFQTLQKKLEGIIKHMGNITERRIEPQESAALLPQQKGSESSCNPLYEDAPDDISSTLFDAQVVEVTSENVSETQKPGNFDPTDNLTPSSPALYDSILCSLQDDQLEDIPGLSDAYDSEESLRLSACLNLSDRRVCRLLVNSACW
ncbi:unnamed protein product [Trichobilharzia regenti]|nr:unnamed protein product [Trichobilharzia regenti]